MLKIAGLFLTLHILLLNACGPLESATTKDNANENDPLIESTEPGTQKTGNNTNNEPGNHPPLKKRIEEKTLLDWIKKVEAQNTPWGCGNVQCGYALVASRSDVNFFNPNDIANYPVSVDIVIPDNIKRLLESQFPQIASIQTQKFSDGKKHFIVGALPGALPQYLKGLGANNARHLALDSLSKKDFINEIMENASKNRPLIAMIVSDAEKFLLHYVSLVGVSDDGNKVLILDTTGKDRERLRWEDTDAFMQKLETKTFKAKLNEMIPQINILQSVASKSGIIIKKLIPTSDINKIGNFNLISFK